MTADHAFDVVTLGETMLRMVPPGSLRIGQSDTLQISFGGAESSVAVNLAGLGNHTSWWSRLPDNPFGHHLVRTLRGYGVDTSQVLFDPAARLGIYFVEMGRTPRGIQVWYDRRNSAASLMQPDELPTHWIERSRWLHLTGITPALSANCRLTTERAVEHARRSGVTISFDVNYRALLWPPEEAAAVLNPLCELADITFIARRDAKHLFGVSADDLSDVARSLHERWGGTVVVTSGEQGAAACNGDTTVQVAAVQTIIIDRLGAGDAFTSGVIDQLLAGATLEHALRFAAALAALKLSIVGDVAFVTRAEVERVLNDPTSFLRR